MSIAFLHTAIIVMFRGVHNFVSFRFDPFIFLNICFFPSSCLIPAGQNKDQSYIRIDFFQFQDRHSRDRIEAAGTARTKISISVFNAFNQYFSQSFFTIGRFSGGIFLCPVKQAVLLFKSLIRSPIFNT